VRRMLLALGVLTDSDGPKTPEPERSEPVGRSMQ